MMKKKSLVLLCCIWGVILPLFPQTGKYNSLMWEISGNGLNKPSYLYGTMHVSRKVAFHLSDSFFLAISSVDMIALESNPELWLKEFSESDQFRDFSDMFGDGLFSGGYGFYENTFYLEKPGTGDYKALLRNEPGMANGLLYRSSYNRENFEEDTYLDLFIYQAGKKLGKKISSLEDFKESMELADKARKPDKGNKKNKEEWKKKMELLESGINLYEKMEDAYRSGDLDLLDSISRLMNTSDNYQKYLIDERNKIMARNMDSLMRHQRVFSGIGAAHLPGKEGVIELLRRMGYKVRPVIFSAPKDSKHKMRIDKLRVPLVYQKQFPKDSAFSVEVPGELIETDAGGLTRQYLYSDMGNGSYYWVMRMQTMSAWTGQSQQEVFAKIDSLLFENIPGKILSKKEIVSTNGFPGVAIVNKTRKGDCQQYRIYVSPAEVFVFKTSGRGDYAKGAEVNAFFNSISFRTRANAVQEFTSPENGFSIRMPQPCQLSGSGADKTHTFIASDEKNGNLYMVMRSSYYDFDFIEQDSFELNYLQENFLKTMKFDPEGGSNLLTGGKPSRQFKARQGNCFLHGRFVINGPDYYLAAMISRDSVLAGDFFSSFRITGLKSTAEFKEQPDSSMLFKVKTNAKMQDDNRSLLEELYNGIQEDQGGDAFAFDQRITEEQYRDPVTGEKVKVKFKKLHKYFYEDTLDSFWDAELREHFSYKKHTVKSRVTGKKNGADILDAVIAEQASSRAIRLKMILSNGALWTLSACTDSSGALSPFVNEFLGTFTPFDTVIGKPIYTDKAAMLLDHLLGSDSADKLHAGNAVYYVSYYFTDSHFSRLTSFMKTPQFFALELRKRAELITALGRMKKSNVIPLLEQMYSSAADTASLQFAVLQALTMLSSKQGNEVFLKLILKETPLTSEYEEYSIDQVFTPLYNDASLAKVLYPGLFKLLRFREYEYPVYTLLSFLVREKKIKPEQVAGEKDAILRLANDEIKRTSTVKTEEGYQYRGFNVTNLSGEQDKNANLRYGNETLFKFANILSLYFQEAPVKAFFGKLKKVKDEDLRIALACRFLKLGIAVPDSLWEDIAMKPSNRTSLICWLQDSKFEKLFPGRFKSPEHLSEGCLHEVLQPGDEDSLQFDSMIIGRGKKGDANLYIYKFKQKDTKEWQWCAVAFGKKDINGFPETSYYQGLNQPVEDEKDRKRMIASFLLNYRLDGRERASQDASNSFFPGLFNNIED